VVVPDSSLPALLNRVDHLMDDLQAWLADREAQARTRGDRQDAQSWQQRRLRLRAYRQGLLTLLNEESDPPA
jgi:hypothetical protein